jgi:hypothetical protein
MTDRPIAPPVELMEFPAAMQKVLDGHRITRVEWDNPDVQVFLIDGLLKIRLGDGSLKALLVSDGDMAASDWCTVEPTTVRPQYVVHG